jgi:hypothetical protein
MNEKVKNALRWITSVLDKIKVPYKIGGGLAANYYGSGRKVNDIDISISGKYFQFIMPEVSEHITAGPKHYLNEKWDCDTLSLNYNGQDIDLTDVDTLKMSTLDKSEWIKVKDIRLYDTVPVEIDGIKVSLMDPRDLIAYKKELDGDHQKIDVLAVEKYINQNS